MIAIPAFDPGASRAQPAGAKGATAKEGGPNGFGAAIDQAARKPERMPSKSDADADDTGKPSYRASSSGGHWTLGTAVAGRAEAELAKAAKDAVATGEVGTPAQPKTTTTEHHGKKAEDEADAADDKKDGDKDHKKAAAAATPPVLPLVVNQTPATPLKAKDDTAAAASGGTAKITAADTAKAVAGKAAAAEAAPVKQPSAEGASAPSKPGAKSAPPVSVETDGGQHSGMESALSNLRTRLSATHTVGASSSDAQPQEKSSKTENTNTKTPKVELPRLEGKEQQPETSKAGSASSREGQTAAAAPTTSPAPQGAPVASGAVPGPQNAATLADAIVSRTDWTQALSQPGKAAHGSQGGHVSALKLQLSPAELGTVTATLRVSGNQLVISLQVQTAEAYRQLSTGNDAILDKLKGHGYAVENITVQHIAVGGSTGSQQAQQQQPQQQGFLSQQGGQNAAAGGGNRFAGQGQGQGGGQPAPFFDPAAPVAGEPARNTGVGSRRAGGVWV
ncbi:MAG TPA: flagellar hook-length control protein FliK [Pararhizobium sp.]|nr:flagellar hook-length control protein FliK [Pararhizobium sp.]